MFEWAARLINLLNAYDYFHDQLYAKATQEISILVVGIVFPQVCAFQMRKGETLIAELSAKLRDAGLSLYM